MMYKNLFTLISLLLICSSCTFLPKNQNEMPDLKYSDLKFDLEDELSRMYRYRDDLGVINFKYKVNLNDKGSIDILMMGNHFSYTDKIWVRADGNILKKLLDRVANRVRKDFDKDISIFIIDKNGKIVLRYIEQK